jgi:phage terminase small subunit
MAGKGPPRTPTAILKSRGSKLAPERVASEPEFDCIAPAPMFPLSEAEQVVWDYTVPLLVTTRVLTTADREAITRYCKLVVKFSAETDTDKLIRISGALNQLSDRFGLNPAARSRVQAVAAKATGKSKDRFFGGPKLASG